MMKELKTLLGEDIPMTTRGILYLCKYDYEIPSLTVIREILFDSAYDTVDYYANIPPNPESQIALGEDYNELITELNALHKRMSNKKWVQELVNYL